MRKICLRTAHIVMASLLVAAPLLWQTYSASAEPLTSRSVRVASPIASETTSHTFNFNIPSVNNVGSIVLQYCSNSPQIASGCTVPAGLSLSGASLASQSGETGFSIDGSSTVNKIVLTRPPAPTSIIPVSYVFNGVVNQSTPNSTVYVRIATYASTNGTGSYIDQGSVAYSTTKAISVSGFVPPYLTFCVGVVVALNCTNTTGSQLNFGEFSSSQTRFVSSQFSIATNDPGGYAASVIGTTMTSGNNIIPALATPQGSQSGTSQFGMNLRANSNPAIGADPAGIGSGSIASNYANPNQFYFNNGLLAASVKSSDFNAFTVSYIVNINQAQRPGIYTTTLTYIGTAAF